MPKLLPAQKALRDLASPADAEHAQRFFKSGKGEYGEGDVFLGVRVPETRRLAKQFRDVSNDDVLMLLHSKYHEERHLALFIWVLQYEKGDEARCAEIYRDYLKHTAQINNWDLVDCSAYKIVGPHLMDRPRKKLYQLAKSKLLWDRRIAVLATLAFIKRGDLVDILALSKLLLNDPEDLMHKALGWMLREAAKKDEQRVKAFLAEHYQAMPRTMLRYAIEKFPKAERRRYLEGDI
jgi:3-methyladenine DNA glycosylase AlkD